MKRGVKCRLTLLTYQLVLQNLQVGWKKQPSLAQFLLFLFASSAIAEQTSGLASSMAKSQMTQRNKTREREENIRWEGKAVS
ncbi:hypothetical protein CEXT_142791 [Caerostris extrusa]|uniref:Secreted protein n=1 Tax=Caerostris extrusa TaxID=172846 RepID=A0AAV4UJL2_CAEEX|nr:hypothetical protein CEXT_142791 [Caerostris extrusa]